MRYGDSSCWDTLCNFIFAPNYTIYLQQYHRTYCFISSKNPIDPLKILKFDSLLISPSPHATRAWALTSNQFRQNLQKKNRFQWIHCWVFPHSPQFVFFFLFLSRANSATDELKCQVSRDRIVCIFVCVSRSK